MKQNIPDGLPSLCCWLAGKSGRCVSARPVRWSDTSTDVCGLNFSTLRPTDWMPCALGAPGLAHPSTQAVDDLPQPSNTPPHCPTNLSPCLEHAHLARLGASCAPHVREMPVCHGTLGEDCNCIRSCSNLLYRRADALTRQLYLLGSNCRVRLYYNRQTPCSTGGGEKRHRGARLLLRHDDCSEVHLSAVQPVHGLGDTLLGHGVSLDDGLDAMQRRKLEHYGGGKRACHVSGQVNAR